MSSIVSGLSGRSRTSQVSSKAEAAADIAALKIQMQYVEVESKKQCELNKLSLQKELDIAEARFSVLSDETERTFLYGRDIHVNENQEVSDIRNVDDHAKFSAEQYVQDYVKNNPLIIPEQVETDKKTVVRPTPAPRVRSIKPEVDLSEITKSLSDHINLGRLPLPEPGTFTGDPIHYISWKSAFETLIENRGVPPAERIYYLKKYLGGSAKECVDGFLLLNTSEAYDEAKTLLDKRFGSPFVIANAFRDKLESWTKIENRDGIALRKLSDYLGQCLIAMQSIGGLGVWDDERENQKILAKLPEWFVFRWSRFVAHWRMTKHSFPPFKEFVTFITKEAEVMCDPVTVTRLKSAVKKTDFSPVLQPRKRSVFNTSNISTSEKCDYCNKDNHNLEFCKSFIAQNLQQKKDFIRERNLCFACLKGGHRSISCSKRSKCRLCSKYHPTPLHGDMRDTRARDNSSSQHRDETVVKGTAVSGDQTAKPTITHVSGNVNSGDQCSMILPVWVSHRDNPHQERLVYALLDTQSDTTFVLDSTCESLQVEGPSVKLRLSTMTAEDQLIDSQKISGLVVRGFDQSVRINLPCAYTRDIMPANRQHIPTPSTVRGWPHLHQLENKLIPLCDIDVGLLIGYNCPQALVPREIIPPVSDNAPYGQRTDLGWGVVGTICHSDIEDNTPGISHRVMTAVVPNDLRPSVSSTGENVFPSRVHVSYRTSVKEVVCPMDIAHMMELDFHEKNNNEEPISHDDRDFLNQMENSITQMPDKHYEMKLPFKGKEPSLPDNRTVAKDRLLQLKRRLDKNEGYRNDYKSFMDKLLINGHAERVPLYDAKNIWYIPHHAVYHPKKKDKIRVVFDCSAQHLGASLNDHLLKGPELTNTLIGVLCRFRKEPIAIQCDIEQMFYQFKVAETHRDYLRFLWWDTENFDTEPTDFRMTVHLFGAASSPGCANYGLKQVSRDYESQYGPEVAKFVREDFYVDDGLTSVSTVCEAVELIQKSKQMCSEGGIRLHKFMSNSRDVLAAIPEEDCAKEVKGIDLMRDPLPLERALGVNWCIESDTFQFRITLLDRPLVRRSVLSTVMSIYDPLGFLAPVMLVGKQIMQAACRDQLDWDSPLPDALRSRWEKWRSELFHLERLAIPRCYKPPGEIKSQELHHFADASMTGYGQCTYLRSIDTDNNVHCAFIMGKARVCPLKPVTIPRLELTAAVVSINVSQFLQKELRHEHEKIREIYWSDSKAVLGYIGNDSARYHVFVANRVQKIREHTEPNQWRHVKGTDNPADEASRGMSAVNFANSSWLNGPKFLHDNSLDLEIDESESFEISSDDVEVKQVKTLASAVVTSFEVSRLDHCSSWSRAKKAVAHCLRLKQRLLSCAQSRVRNEKVVSCEKSSAGELSVSDVEKASVEIIKAVQAEAFPRELEILRRNKHVHDSHNDCPDDRQGETKRKQSLRQVKGTSPLFKLDPFVDPDGVIRVGGRVQHSDLADSLKHPVILPKSHITNLIVKHFHEKVAHQGRGITSNAIRSHGFWILGCSSLVGHHISKCVKCRRLRHTVQRQKMSSLPGDRMAEAPPFSYCGMDMFGPFYVKEGRKELKRYGALFTCLVCRAVHIEVTNSLSTDSFINALRRFIAVRGPVRQLRCDQGTNFVGAQKELYDSAEIKNYLLDKDCDYIPFVMNPPSASHMGGAWERQIRTVRSVLSSLLTQVGKQLDDEGLRTLMAEVMAVVNSRPLTVENLFDPTSPEPLTPNHLLTTKSSIILPPPGKFQKEDVYSRKQWRRVQHCVNEFWYRWKREFVQNLQVRQRWLRPQSDMRKGDVVLVKDDNLPRNQWKVARICEIYPGKDKLVRSVKLAMASRDLTNDGKRLFPVIYLERPVHKLVLLVENCEL